MMVDDNDPPKGQPESETVKAGNSKRAIGLTALGVALIAFICAAMSPWASPFFEPDLPGIEDKAVDIVISFKEKIASRLREEPPSPAKPKEPLPINWYPAITVGLGVIGVCLGVIGFVCHEDKRVCLSAVMLAFSAILIQYFLMLAAAVLVILLIGVLLSALGFSP